MKLGAFELKDPLPDLKDPHAFAILHPWVDVGNVGTLALSRLETESGAVPLGKLARPGAFFDFTRYRPTFQIVEGARKVSVPNTTVSCALTGKDNDFLFLKLLEPHMLAETYVDSVLELLKKLGVKRYYLLGSMYDMVPYTRPLLLTGHANFKIDTWPEAAKLLPSDYVGPTSMMVLITQKAAEMGIETCTMVVHLPNYLGLDDDYRGQVRLMEVLSPLYGFPPSVEDANKAREQVESVAHMAEQILKQEPQYKVILQQLEESYDSRVRTSKQTTRLSPQLEQFLQDLGKRLDHG